MFYKQKLSLVMRTQIVGIFYKRIVTELLSNSYKWSALFCTGSQSTLNWSGDKNMKLKSRKMSVIRKNIIKTPGNLSALVR